MNPSPIPFLGTEFASSPEGARAALFAAPHGTPYKGIDNSVHAASGETIRKALADDAQYLDSVDFDFGAALPPKDRFRAVDLGDLKTKAGDAVGNRKLIAD